MSVPRSILKKRPSHHVQAGPSKPRPMAGGGSKLKHTLAIAKPKHGPKGMKRSRPEPVEDEGEKDEDARGGGDEEDEDMDEDEDMGGEGESDDEIGRPQGTSGKSKKSNKKKPPTSASTFGQTLTSLLSEISEPQPPAKRPRPLPKSASHPRTEPISKPTSRATPSKSSQSTKGKPKAQTILSLSRSLPPSKSQISLEHRARVKLRREKEEREDRARIKDIAEGWAEPQVAGGVGGMEFEKTLRKTAQRGVIKLFNAILVASKNVDPAQEGLAASMGGKEDKKKRETDNVLGRGGKEKPLTKEGFLDMVRKG